MNKKNLELLPLLFNFILIPFGVIAFFYENINIKIMFGISLILIIISQILLICTLKYRRNTKNKSIDKLNLLIEYNQKRKEIEHEIYVLTNELAKSDVGNYLDINNLIFNGQQKFSSDTVINYENFLAQFGLINADIKIEEGRALFLTPFNSHGDILFKKCQNILSKMDIFLRRTDQRVEKEDILMNIVYEIVRAEFIIVNIDGRNPNVYYELGIAHAIGKPTILISKTNFSSNEIGFDIRQKRIITYTNLDNLEKELLYHINRIRKHNI